MRLDRDQGGRGHTQKIQRKFFQQRSVRLRGVCERLTTEKRPLLRR